MIERRTILAALGAAGTAGLTGNARAAGPAPSSVPGSKWYDKAIVIDGLAGWDVNNVLYPLPAEHLPPDRLNNIRKSGITAINLTVSQSDLAGTLKRLSHAVNEIYRNPDLLLQARSVADIFRAKREGKLGVILGFQRIECLADDLSIMDSFRKLGVIIMQLTYNNQNAFGAGSLIPDDRSGLTPLGVEAVKRMNALAILPDASHANPRTAMGVIRESSTPITISHTGCQAIFDHPRNVPDMVLKACADRGGVVGIYLMAFLGRDPDAPTANLVMRHIEHALNVCGEDHVGIGSDLSITPVELSQGYIDYVRASADVRVKEGVSAPGEADIPIFTPELNDARRMEMIAQHLSRRGHPLRVVEKVIGTNVLRLYKDVWKQ